MATSKHLAGALQSVDWNNNVASFCNATVITSRFETASLRIATWSKQFENIEGSNNPAICFVREMQTAGHLAVTATALCCYKLAASGMRTMIETALYYTYFRLHPAELATLIRDNKWHIKKQDIIEYHQIHTVGFAELQKKYSIASLLSPWYSKMSAIIHGQLPGVWHAQNSISDTVQNDDLLVEVIEEFENCVELIDRIFFCTAGRELWQSFSSTSKKALMHGMAGETKALLGIDAA